MSPQGTHSKTGAEYALKALDVDSFVADNSQKQIKNEIDIMRRVSHPHIINFHDVFYDDKSPMTRTFTAS